MELNLTTFLLEILNFLVLVWILSRFLYKPVLAIIERRRAAIEKTLADTALARREADAAREQYERRLTDWEQERDRARARQREELDAERAKAVAKLQASLDAERDKARVLEARRLEELTRQAEEAAAARAALFAARLFDRLAGPELERRILDAVIEDLAGLPEERRTAIRATCAATDASAGVTSAFPVPADRREGLASALAALAGRPVACVWTEDPALGAGLRVSLGPWALRASLRDELEFFKEADAHGRHPCAV